MNTKAIYMIKCNDNDGFYIGSSKNIWSRFSYHLYNLRKGNHTSYLLQKSFNEYGEKSINMIVLEFVSDISVLKEREKIYIKDLSPKFNTYIGYRGGINKRKRLRETA